MRAIAACQFSLNRFGVWRLAVMALTGSVVLTLLFWFLGQPLALHWGIAAAVGVVAIASLGLGASLGQIKEVSLSWDGLDWHVGPADSAGHEGAAGTLSVTLDLGAWMLLRFQADTPGRGSRMTWLPVQRRGLEPQWHELRCAVYSPRPARDAAPDAARDADAAADL
jgi:hypothetical protein